MNGGENRKFILVVFLSFLVVLIGTVATTLAFSINAINDNADTSVEQYKELVREDVEGDLYDFSRLLRNPDIKQILTEGSGGDMQTLTIALFNMLEITLGEPYYLIMVEEGMVAASKLPGEIGKPLPEDVSVQGSRIIDEFRGKSGELLMAGAPINDDLSAAVVVDITDEIEEARAPFEDQKRHILWISLLLFIFFLVLSTLVVFLLIAWANSRYISGPIKDLEEKANKLMAGDPSVEIDVDEKSDYYALQALLDSMQRMLMEMESRTRE